jgi:hypothetical protein
MKFFKLNSISKQKLVQTQIKDKSTRVEKKNGEKLRKEIKMQDF